jgi:hypothetical protein
MAFIGKESVTVTSLDSAESMSVVTDLTVDTNTLKVDSASNRVGILNATPGVSLDIGSATDAIHIPVGTTAERPGSPASGLFRYNTSLNQFEGYTSTWGAIGGGGTNTFTHDSFTGDDTTTDFVLSQTTESENNLFVFIDGVFQTQDAYSISTNSGVTTLSLSAAPLLGRKIIVYTVAAGVSGNNLNQNLFDANTTDAVDGINTAFTLSIPPVNKNNTQVFFDGVYQHKANYSISGSVLTFTDAPPLGVIVEVMIFTQTAVNVPVDNSVTSAKLSGDLVAPGNLTVTGYLAGPATFIIDPAAVGDNTGTLLVKGDLQVDGTQTIINSTTLTVDDLNITVASGAANALAADGAGITVDTGTDPDATITYDGVNDKWDFNKNVSVTGSVTADKLITDSGVDAANFTSTGSTYVDINNGTVTGRLQTISSDFFIGTATVGTSLAFKSGNGVEAMRIDSSQNVGIGVSASLQGKLNVGGDLGGDPSMYVFGSRGAADNLPAGHLTFRNVANGVGDVNLSRIQSLTGTGGNQTQKGQLAFSTNDGSSLAERMRIDASGRVLINKTSSTGSLNLEVQAPTGFSVGSGFYAAGSQSTIEFKDGNTTANYKVRIGSETDDLLMFAGGSERMRIDASGLVGIGGAATSFGSGVAVLQLTGTSSGNATRAGALRFKSQDGTSSVCDIYSDNGFMSFYTGTSTSTAERMRIDDSGNVGIGEINPVQKFQISADAGAARMSFERTNVNTTGGIGSIQWNALDGHAVAGVMAYGDGNDEGAHLVFNTTSAASSSDVYVSTTERMRIDSSGKVFISGGPTTGGTALEFSVVYAADSGYYSTFGSVGQWEHYRGDGSNGGLAIKTDLSSGVWGSGGGFITFSPRATQVLKLEHDNVVFNEDGANVDFRVESVNNANMLFVDASTDRVGIGTNSPTAPLTVAMDAGGIATFTGISAGGVSSVTMKQSRGSIASPSNSATAGDGNYLLSQVYNSGYSTIGSIGIITGSALDNGEIQFNTANGGSVEERMRIGASGQVKITDGGSLNFDAAANGNYDIAYKSADNTFNIISNSSSAAMGFHTNSSEHMRIDANGNLLVGLTSGQAAQIHVQAPKPTYTDYATVFAGGTDSNNGQHAISLMTSGNGLGGLVGSNVSIDGATFTQPVTARTSGYFTFNNSTNVGQTSTLTYSGFTKGTTTPVERFKVDGDGNVGIGISPLQKLHVSGSVFASGYYITALQGNAQLTNVSTSSGSNPSYIGQGLISVTISDAKAKENFGPVEENECLNKVVSLAEHVKKFDWIDEDWKKEKGRTVGMVAQEIYENHSEFVHKPENYNDDGWAIRHQEMVPTLIKAIQEQQEQIEQLKADIAVLKGDN